MTDITTFPIATVPLESPGGDLAELQAALLALGLEVSVKRDLTSDELLHLTSAPIDLIPAQGAGTIIIVGDVFVNNIFGTTAYVSTGFGEGLYYKDDLAANGADQHAYTINGLLGRSSHQALCETISAKTVSVSNTLLYPGTGSTGPLLAFSPENQTVVLGGEISDMTDGDGTATITVFYKVVRV